MIDKCHNIDYTTPDSRDTKPSSSEEVKKPCTCSLPSSTETTPVCSRSVSCESNTSSVSGAEYVDTLSDSHANNNKSITNRVPILSQSNEEKLAKYLSTVVNLQEKIKTLNTEYKEHNAALNTHHAEHSRLQKKIAASPQEDKLLLTNVLKAHNAETQQLHIQRERTARKLDVCRAVLRIQNAEHASLLTTHAALSETQRRLQNAVNKISLS